MFDSGIPNESKISFNEYWKERVPLEMIVCLEYDRQTKVSVSPAEESSRSDGAIR